MNLARPVHDVFHAVASVQTAPVSLERDANQWASIWTKEKCLGPIRTVRNIKRPKYFKDYASFSLCGHAYTANCSKEPNKFTLECSSKVTLSGVNGNEIMSGCGDDNPEQCKARLLEARLSVGCRAQNEKHCMGILSATQSPPQRQLALRVMEWRKRSERCCNMHQRRFNSRRMGILTAVQIPLWGVASDYANTPVFQSHRMDSYRSNTQCKTARPRRAGFHRPIRLRLRIRSRNEAPLCTKPGSITG